MPARIRTMCTRVGASASIARYNWARASQVLVGLCGGSGDVPGLSELCVPCIPSTTPQASTVSAACLASTVLPTSRWTHPMSVAVSRAVFQSTEAVSSSLSLPDLPTPGGEAITPHHFLTFISDCPSGCDCESDFTDGTCEDLTGRCYCRPNFTGEQCSACAKGYTGFPHCYREDQLGAGGGGLPPEELSGLRKGGGPRTLGYSVVLEPESSPSRPG